MLLCYEDVLRKIRIEIGNSSIWVSIDETIDDQRLSNRRMGNLQSFRVQPQRPFLQVGLDYGGPFIIGENCRCNAKTSKAYLALFACMTVKAVHLELVTDLSTAAFLAALNRFVARRGIPWDLFSDY